MIKTNIQLININSIFPYEKNPRKNDSAVDVVAKSIEQFGFKVPIVIDANNIIVAGHTRYKAAQKLGLESVPCIIADDLTPEQIKTFRLVDNKSAELSSWDDAFLIEELNDLASFNIDMTDFGFDTSKIGSWHKSWARTLKYCDLRKKIRAHSNGNMIFSTFYEVSKKGIPINQIKENPRNIQLFADNLCDYLICVTGGGGII